MNETCTPQYSGICRLLQQYADNNRKLVDGLFETFLKRAKRLKQRRERSGLLLSEDWLEEEEILCDELVRLNRQRAAMRQANAALADAIKREEEEWLAKEEARLEAEAAKREEQELSALLADDSVYGNA
jgi:hypothetical protein